VIMHPSVLRTTVVLGFAWLLSLGVLLFFVAHLVDITWLLLAVVVQIGVFLAALGMLLVTNTRRPRGIDPDVLTPRLMRTSDESLLKDPLGMTASELARAAVLLPDGNSYGRRKHDDREIVKRVIAKIESLDSPRPHAMPDWASAVIADHTETP